MRTVSSPVLRPPIVEGITSSDAGPRTLAIDRPLPPTNRRVGDGFAVAFEDLELVSDRGEVAEKIAGIGVLRDEAQCAALATPAVITGYCALVVYVVAAPVSGVGVPGHQVQPFQVVDQIGQHGAVDAEVLGDRALVARRLTDRGGQDLITPRAAGQITQRMVGRLHVRAEHHAQHPAQVALEVAG